MKPAPQVRIDAIDILKGLATQMALVLTGYKLRIFVIRIRH